MADSEQTVVTVESTSRRKSSMKKEKLVTEPQKAEDSVRAAKEDLIRQYFKFNSSPTDIDSLVNLGLSWWAINTLPLFF